MGGKTTPEEKREAFFAKVVVNPGACYGWTGSIAPNGYGRYAQKWAHRLAHIYLIGPIPDGWDVDHVAAAGCVSRVCTNPAHLEAVPTAVNRRRQPNVIAQLSRTHCPRGHPYSGDNLRLRPGMAKRGCRECDRISARKRYVRLQAERHAS